MKRSILVLLLAVLYLPALGSASAGTHPDEAYYLGIGAEMAVRGAWLTPTLDGVPRWFKPPLLYWAQHAAFAVLGRGFLAGRLPCALAAIALALLTGALARRMHGERAGLTAALLVATTFGWVRFGRLAMMDAPLALALTAAAYGAWRAAEEDRRALLLLAGAGAGAAMLLKGPVGPVLVLLLAGGFVALRRPALLATRWMAGAVALGAAIALPWFALSLAVHGRAFWDFFVVQQNVDRFRHPWTAAGEATLLVGAAAFLLPWTALAVGGCPRPRRWREPAVLLPLLWIGVVLGVFTVPALKWPHYGLACAPAAALLASREAPPQWARLVTAAVLAACALLAGAALRWPLPAAGALACGAAAFALAVAAVLAARARLEAAALAAGAAAALVAGVAVPAVNPPVIPAPALARLAGRDLALLDRVPGLFTLAAGRPVRRVDDAGVARTLDAGGVVILDEAGLRRARLGGPVATVARWSRARSYLPPAEALRAWRAGDPAPLLEPVLAVERAGPPPLPPGSAAPVEVRAPVTRPL